MHSHPVWRSSRPSSLVSVDLSFSTPSPSSPCLQRVRLGEDEHPAVCARPGRLDAARARHTWHHATPRPLRRHTGPSPPLPSSSFSLLQYMGTIANLSYSLTARSLSMTRTMCAGPLCACVGINCCSMPARVRARAAFGGGAWWCCTTHCFLPRIASTLLYAGTFPYPPACRHGAEGDVTSIFEAHCPYAFDLEVQPRGKAAGQGSGMNRGS